MRLFIRLFFLLLLSLAASAPAFAHSLKLFATVEGDLVRGHGFFVGGGRPQNVRWSASMQGKIVAQGKTDKDGAFGFPAPEAIHGPLTISINVGDGHVASKVLAASRFGASVPLAQSATPPSPEDQTSSNAQRTPSHQGQYGLSEAEVRRAVAREITPLLIRIEEMDARLRLADIVSGLCMIFGLVGITIWAKTKR